ncbi:hypothetical protein BDP81DRAFT_196729 [Colletotrichum phormii]|uniref:Uncharacterized protein n=1 Tax=Colletotrichum phormii TaxID=359342 RepID=A0AAJ0EHC8_9PEZI|nr:uncharacterized protein BDP81DRAFT_196729 [Colletotrichum phormii]KAK1639098.1 hypothetical protein BDP81DRAFT_196729 [Colletotrichum phormii]
MFASQFHSPKLNVVYQPQSNRMALERRRHGWSREHRHRQSPYLKETSRAVLWLDVLVQLGWTNSKGPGVGLLKHIGRGERGTEEKKANQPASQASVGGEEQMFGWCSSSEFQCLQLATPKSPVSDHISLCPRFRLASNCAESTGGRSLAPVTPGAVCIKALGHGRDG